MTNKYKRLHWKKRLWKKKKKTELEGTREESPWHLTGAILAREICLFVMAFVIEIVFAFTPSLYCPIILVKNSFVDAQCENGFGDLNIDSWYWEMRYKFQLSIYWECSHRHASRLISRSYFCDYLLKPVIVGCGAANTSTDTISIIVLFS